MKKNKSNNLIKILLFLLLLIILYFLFKDKSFFNFSDINLLAQKINSLGIFSPLIYIGIMAIAIVISPIPSLPLAAASGIIWGPLLGTIYSIIGAEIGALISFFIARRLGRNIVRKLLKKDIHISDKLIKKYGVYIIFIARLFPIFQFDVISYGAGLTKIDWKKFAIATFFGMIPATLAFTYLGKSIFINSIYGVIFGIILIALMLLAPTLLKKFKIKIY